MDHDLERFVAAQHDSHDRALAEISRGRKQSHWMWWMFPQLAGLGRSPTARQFALHSLQEARAYLAHPVLGPRLLACITALQDLPLSDPEAVFGATDALKLRSSLTLFALADPAQRLFTAALERWFKGVMDTRTLDLLGEAICEDRS